MFFSSFLTLDTNNKLPKHFLPKVEKYHLLRDYLVKL